MIVTVQVTSEDIAHGLSGNCDRCPVALAIRRLLLPGIFVRAGTWFFALHRGSDVSQYNQMLPGQAVDFITAFDSGKTPEPFEFQIDIPARFLRSE